MAKRIFK